MKPLTIIPGPSTKSPSTTDEVLARMLSRPESDDGEAEIRSISLLIAGESKGEPRRILDERPLGRATSVIPRGLSSAARRSGWNPATVSQRFA